MRNNFLCRRLNRVVRS